MSSGDYLSKRPNRPFFGTCFPPSLVDLRLVWDLTLIRPIRLPCSSGPATESVCAAARRRGVRRRDGQPIRRGVSIPRKSSGCVFSLRSDDPRRSQQPPGHETVQASRRRGEQPALIGVYGLPASSGSESAQDRCPAAMLLTRLLRIRPVSLFARTGWGHLPHSVIARIKGPGSRRTCSRSRARRSLNQLRAARAVLDCSLRSRSA